MTKVKWAKLLMLVLLFAILKPASAQLEQNTSSSWGSTATPIPVLEELQCSDTNTSFLEQYGTALCGDTNFYCLEIAEIALQPEVKTGNTVTTKEKRGIPAWENLFGDTTEREIVMKINRRNIKLTKGVVLAVPRDMTGKSFMDYSPYPYKIDPPGNKLIIWDPSLLAYGAYAPDGNLVRWGPGAGGKDYCHDVGRGCQTKTGTFKIIRKEGPNYRSSRYPAGCIGSNCAKMPYAAFFHEQGYAFHEGNVPGANASHGCIRVFGSDALWLHKWLEIETDVIIRPYPKNKK